MQVMKRDGHAHQSHPSFWKGNQLSPRLKQKSPSNPDPMLRASVIAKGVVSRRVCSAKARVTSPHLGPVAPDNRIFNFTTSSAPPSAPPTAHWRRCPQTRLAWPCLPQSAEVPRIGRGDVTVDRPELSRPAVICFFLLLCVCRAVPQLIVQHLLPVSTTNLTFPSLSTSDDSKEKRLTGRIAHCVCVNFARHGPNARVPHAGLQPLRRKVLSLLRLAHRRRIVGQLWHSRQRPRLLSWTDGARHRSRDDVSPVPHPSFCFFTPP